MRLIDADALVDIVETARKKARTLTGMDFVMVTKKQPTIDAIPVEWMRSQLKNNPNDIESAYDDICINELIDKWQKEQEAR